LRCKVLTLTAKDKICFLDTPDCRPDACEFARGHFDRVKPALNEIFARDAFDRQAVEEVSRAHRVCPFEFSLFLSLWSDVIIGDFNYAFDPRVYLRRFFDPPQDDYAFLVDEAHNLPDRAREMFSADLRKSEFSNLRKAVKAAYPSVMKTLARITPHFSRVAREINQVDTADPSAAAEPGRQYSDLCRYRVAAEVPEALVQVLRRFLKVAEACLVETEPSDTRTSLLEIYFRVTAFVRVAETFDKNFVCYRELEGTEVRIRLFCLDPSDLLSDALKRARSGIFFSATLLPMSYFFEILGGRAGGKVVDRVLRLSSPFVPERLGLMVLPYIRTEFRVRERSFEAISEIICATISSRKGNYLVYFPSYRYLASVREIFASRHPEFRTLEQLPGMSEDARDEFLRAFSADNVETLVGFVVMGGIFGEGIDLRGERLVGSLVIGVGLPQICLERDLIRDFFERKSGTGFEFAYRYPGMNRVLQAAGRVIRTEKDRGVVLLVDERFIRQGYRTLFPKEWSHFETVSSEDALKRALSAFWKGFP